MKLEGFVAIVFTVAVLYAMFFVFSYWLGPAQFVCSFEQTKPTVFYVSEPEVRGNSVLVIATLRGRTHALRRDRIEQCEEVQGER